MDVVSLPLDQLNEAPWNPNIMHEAMLQKLKESITRFGLVQTLVVRPLRPGSGQAMGEDTFEVLSGNQRLQVLRELGHREAPCVVVDLEPAQARLLSLALNRIQGEDDLGLRAELLREVLKELPTDRVVSILPETAESLAAMASLGQETMASHLQAWQAAQSARLKHLQFQLIPAQLEVVEEALAPFLPKTRSKENDSPNRRGTALYLLCRAHLKSGGV